MLVFALLGLLLQSLSANAPATAPPAVPASAQVGAQAATHDNTSANDAKKPSLSSKTSPAEAADFPPNPRAAVLGTALYQAALDPKQPIDAILAQLEHPDIQRALKRRALIFADLQLRGLRRFCAHDSAQENAAEASYARIPATAFTATELAKTRAALPLIDANLNQHWHNDARRYHDAIRALKQHCPGAPGTIHRLSESFSSGLLRTRFLGPAGDDLRELLDDYIATMDLESAFPRVQYAVNGLSYRLGSQGLERPGAVAALHRFLLRYQKFAQNPGDQSRLFDLAIEASKQRADLAVWMLAFAFRNFPHIYELYLRDPLTAAKLEVLFLRLKFFRESLRFNDAKMRLHFPAQAYKPGAKRASPYHFWSAGYVAMELVRKGHWPAMAAFLGGFSQVGYESYAAFRYAFWGPEKQGWWGSRLRGFVQRHASVDDATGGVLGAIETLSLLRPWMPIRVDNTFVNLRREAWRWSNWVQQKAPENTPH